MISIKILPDGKGGPTYEALRTLWGKAFGDSPAAVDAFWDNWGDDITGYSLAEPIIDEYGKETGQSVVSSLVVYRGGDLVIEGEDESRPAYISYAVCTDEADRGKGYASRLVEIARDDVIASGGASLLAPAAPQLVRFYQPLGYEPKFYASQKEIACSASDSDDADAADASIAIERITPAEYGALRENLLAGTTHIRLSEATLRYAEHVSDGLYSLAGGKIIAATEKNSIRFTEVIADASLEPADVDAAVAALGRQLGKELVRYISPSYEYLDSGRLGIDYVQGMIARQDGWSFSLGYYGFTFD